MIKVWAILEDISSEHEAIYPTILADSLEAIKTYVEENEVENPIIVYKELDGAFKCGYDEGDDIEPNWNYWDGEKCLGHNWKNIKTGEFDPNFEDRDVPEEEWDDWVDGIMYEVYKNGKYIKTYFE